MSVEHGIDPRPDPLGPVVSATRRCPRGITLGCSLIPDLRSTQSNPMSNQIHDHDRMMLERAARRALRGHGEAEPNPSVGCVIADASGRVVGEGRTRHPGGPHAEIEAIRAAAAAARGGTAWVTLEPCNHHGKTPPCVDAIIAAGIARVVVGSPESNEFASGGMDRLREAGIEVVLRPDVDSVRRLHASFHGRVSTGLPWVVAKWAETHDGALSTPPGVSPWISGPRSIRLVHRERGRSDAILTGIGTILADDPRLDARQVRRRRTPLRVIVDPDLDTPPTALILKTKEGPVLIACRDDDDDEHRARSERLTAAGATILPIEDPPNDGHPRIGLQEPPRTILGRPLEVPASSPGRRPRRRHGSDRVRSRPAPESLRGEPHRCGTRVHGTRDRRRGDSGSAVPARSPSAGLLRDDLVRSSRR